MEIEKIERQGFFKANSELLPLLKNPLNKNSLFFIKNSTISNSFYYAEVSSEEVIIGLCNRSLKVVGSKEKIFSFRI